MAISASKVEKVTITIPKDLKIQMLELKDEFHLSISSLYKEAIEAYIKQKELEKWHKGVALASKDKEYMKFVEDLGEESGDIYEY